MFNEGISATGDLVDLGVETGVIQKSGAWFSYGQTRLGQGRENVKSYIKENAELFEEIKHKVFEAKGVPAVAGEGTDAGGEQTGESEAGQAPASAASEPAGAAASQGSGKGGQKQTTAGKSSKK
jgi:recombination protein RecA